MFKPLFIFISLSILLAACGGGGSGDGSASTLEGSVETTFLRAGFNSVAYPISVYLPPGHGDDPTASYPVLFVLDAEWRFSDTVDFVEDKNKSVIIVGIGNTDRNVTGRRAVDYRMPGAEPYFNFLVTEIIPYIDSTYLTDVDERTLSGHSLGGLFTGLAVLLEDPDNRYFSHYLSQDGSFWDKPFLTELLENNLSNSGKDINAEVIIGGAELGDGNGEYARWFHDLLDSSNYPSIQLMYWSYAANHSQDFSLSMDEYIDFAY